MIRDPSLLFDLFIQRFQNIKDYKTSAGILDCLREYFDVTLGEIAEYVEIDNKGKE